MGIVGTSFNNFENKMFQKKYAIIDYLEEGDIWEQDIRPLVANLPFNILNIWHYGFTEIFNNAIDHPNGESIEVNLQSNEHTTSIAIEDNGVGIFHKIQSELNLIDPRLAIFELAKGKLTTKPAKHSGEVIFFTSKMMDSFFINSRDLEFSCKKHLPMNVFLDGEASQISGTRVIMTLSNDTPLTARNVFDEFVIDKDEYNFDKTVIPLKLALLGKENLVSRSQAKRVLSRIHQFKHVFLDFNGIEEIGQSFADEIFRVYAKGHTEITLVGINMNDDITKIIMRVRRSTHC